MAATVPETRTIGNVSKVENPEKWRKNRRIRRRDGWALRRCSFCEFWSLLEGAK